MCGRYYIAEDDMDEMLAAYVAEALARAEHMGVPMHLNGEIRPTDTAPVIANSASRRTVGAYPMRWGFRHPTRGMLVFNTRSETAAEKALFCTSISDRRYLIPASGYYEWQKADGKKTKFSFFFGNHEPLYLAGLYLRSSHDKLPFFTILTRNATAETYSPKKIDKLTRPFFTRNPSYRNLLLEQKNEYIESSPEASDAAEALLKNILNFEGERINFTYDFDDNWQVVVNLEKVYNNNVTTASEFPRVLQGSSQNYPFLMLQFPSVGTIITKDVCNTVCGENHGTSVIVRSAMLLM